MKVKLKIDKRIILPEGYKLFYDLDSEKTYSVLSEIRINGKVKFYRIIDESEELYDYPSEVFEIVKER